MIYFCKHPRVHYFNEFPKARETHNLWHIKFLITIPVIQTPFLNYFSDTTVKIP